MDKDLLDLIVNDILWFERHTPKQDVMDSGPIYIALHSEEDHQTNNNLMRSIFRGLK